MTVVIGSIFFFDLVGPLALKYAIKNVNESDNDNTVVSGPKKIIHTPKELFITFLLNLGLIKDREIHPIHSISEHLCRNLLSIHQDANFQQVLKFINEHHLPSYPVIDDDGNLVGTISFQAVKRAKGKFNAKSSATAKELAVYQDFLTEDQNILTALEIFDNLGIAALPVVRKNSKKLIGMLHYKDIIVSA
jgi:predicted transcriptional regulator